MIDTWTVGTLGAMSVLTEILASDRVHVDKARQIRVWSGNLLSDTDYQEAIAELLPFYAPPGDNATKTAAQSQPGNEAPTSAEFFGPGGQFHAETQNFAFSYNMPRFDVRQQLHKINVWIDIYS